MSQAPLDAVNKLVYGLGLVAGTFETAITWDRWPELDAHVRAQVNQALKEVCGGGTLNCRFTHVYTDGPAPYYTYAGAYRQGAYEEQQEVGEWVAEQTSGRVLVESIFNEWVVFPNQDRVVYEGSQDAWTSGLSAPGDAASDIHVVVMRTTPGDEDSVHDALYDTDRLWGFGVVLQTDNFLVLEKGAPGDAVRTRQ